MENPVMILGASGIGKAALDIFNANGIIVYCFLDDDASLHNQEINDIIVMGKPDDDGYLKFIGKKCEVFVANDDQSRRRELVELIEKRRKTSPINAVHPNTIISNFAKVGDGNFINAGSIINSGSTIENYSILNTNVCIEYDCKVESFVQIGAGAIINSKVTIGEGSLIGSGAIIAPGITIGKNAQVAPGAMVMKNVEDEQIVFGNPAKAV